MEPKIEVIRELIQIVEESGLAELTVESGEHAITVRTTERAIAPAAHHVMVAPAEAEAATPVRAKTKSSLAGDQVTLYSPMVGIFYRAPAPGSPPFVEIGSIVEVGQTIGIVEAMKVFNEIPSEVRGRVAAIAVKNEQLVQLTDPLLIIERLDG